MTVTQRPLKRYAIAALPLALFSISLTHAQDTPRYAETANRVATAIHHGMDLRAEDNVPQLLDVEYEALTTLKGCTPAAEPGATIHLVELIWTCGDSEPSMSTLMRFDKAGEMFVFRLHEIGIDHYTKASAWQEDDLPSPKKLAKSLGQAIREGGDPTLGGILPLTPLQMGQLTAESGARFRVRPPMSEASRNAIRRQFGFQAISDPEKDRMYTVVWSNKHPERVGELAARIYFDESERPIRVELERGIIRKATISTSQKIR